MSVPAGAKTAIYMDACCFIDMVKQKVGALPSARNADVWHCRKLLEAARDGHLAVFTSTLTVAECQHVGDGTASREVQELFHRFLMSGQFVVLVQLTPFVAADARDLRWKHGINLQGADAVHVASALDRRCVEFLTTDEGISRPKIAAALPLLAPLGMRMISGDNTALLPGSYRQTNLLTMPPSPGTGQS